AGAPARRRLPRLRGGRIAVVVLRGPAARALRTRERLRALDVPRRRARNGRSRGSVPAPGDLPRDVPLASGRTCRGCALSPPPPRRRAGAGRARTRSRVLWLRRNLRRQERGDL